MPNRGAGGVSYRYGFNGKETENDAKGIGNEIDFGSRVYDSRVGRWFSLDPLRAKYPNESPYTFVSNDPIIYQDNDGKDKIITITIIGKTGRQLVLRIVDKEYFEFLKWDIDMTQQVGYPSRQFEKGFKQDLHIDLTIDLGNPQNSSYTTTTKTVEVYNYRIAYEFARLGIKTSGDNSSKLKVGYVLLGQGSNVEDAMKNERAAYGSEIIDIAGVLSNLDMWRSLSKPPDLSEFASENILNKLLDRNVNIHNALSALHDALELINTHLSQTDELRGSNNPSPRIEPGRKNNQKKAVFFERLDDFGTGPNRERKGRIYDAMYVTDTAESMYKTKNGDSTIFRVRQKKSQ